MSPISRRSLLATTLGTAALTGLAACGSSSGGSSSDSSKPLVIMADATPHTEILEQVQKLNLLGDVKIEVKTMTGDIDPNQLVESGDVDANFFQHVPYLKTWQAQKGVSDLVGVADVQIEPLGLYSKKLKDLKNVPQGATVAIPADPSNLVRALFLLQQAGLLTLNVKPTDKDVDYSQISEKNITANPHGLKFRQIERPQLPASLDDAQVTLSVINGANALQAGIKPKTDALVLETAKDNPYVNILVVKESLKSDPRVTKLAEALQSKQIADWITSNYSGSVLPAEK